MTTISCPYLAYKPSGIPWLGDVPAYWDVVQLWKDWRFLQRLRGNEG